MREKLLPTSGDPMRWTGNVFVVLAAILAVGMFVDWLSGWTTYCWAFAQVQALTYVYGTTIGAVAVIAFAFRRYKLAAAVALPGFFPIIWGVLMREIGFAPACLL